MNFLNNASSQRRISLRSLSIALLTAGLATAQNGNDVETSCDWIGPPNTNTTYTPWVVTPGTVWDTKVRTCTEVKQGTKICTTKQIQKSCAWSVGGQISKTPQVGGGATYVEVSNVVISTATFNVTETRTYKREGCVYIDTVPGGIRIESEPVTVKLATNMVNLWDDFPAIGSALIPVPVIAPTTVTFEGTVIPFGGAVNLNDYGPGTYDYVATRSLNGVTDYIHFVVTVPAEHDAQPRTLTPAERHAELRPIASAIYTNNSDETVSVIGELAGTAYAGLDARVVTPSQTVAPGDTAIIDIEFDTAPGYVLPLGVVIRETLHIVRTDGVDSLGEQPLCSIKLETGSVSPLIGSAEDLQLRSTVGSVLDPYLNVKGACMTDTVSLGLESLNQTFSSADFNALYGDIVDYNNPPAAVPSLPGYRLGAAPISLSAGLIGAPATFDLPLITTTLGMIVRFQGFVASPNAANGSLAFSDAHDIVIEN